MRHECNPPPYRQESNISRNVGKGSKQRKLPVFCTNYRDNVCKDSLLIKFVNRLLGPLSKTSKQINKKHACVLSKIVANGGERLLDACLLFLPYLVNMFLSCKF